MKSINKEYKEGDNFMIKKGIIITVVILMAACVFSACARKAKTPSAVTSIEQKENKGSQQESNSLTENTVQNVCIDYQIESYKNVQKFGYMLFAQHINDKNPVISPVSAYLALSMAGCGANGATKEEFYNVLGNDMLPLSDDMMNRLPTTGDWMNLSIANSAWIDNKFVADATWLGTVKSLMDAEVFQDELSTEQTMDKINRWINDKTNGLIDTMITQPLDIQTRLVLFNTVYFKGKWELPFESQNTRKEDFYIQKGQGTANQVEMMNLYLTELEYIANDCMEGVILPYQKNDINNDGTLAFIALKPTGEETIRDIYSKLTDEVISDLLAKGQTEIVNLKLPKFEVTFDKKLNESLINIGLTECFEEQKANFDQLGKTINNDTLYIDLVRQKAKIIVDEEGTEAAAATEVLMMDRGAMLISDPREVYFNEPFIYMIMDMQTDVPLFLGILDNPNTETK
ncbi:hypothetical protein IMSAGC011_00274 [Lachnospiraceae bacterium]|nr:hypothetical protein IMSAGC011_00274 [Lachnospiraceae bacterium]